MPFYGYNRPGAKISEGIREHWWLQGMLGSIKGHYDCIKVFSETDTTEDLKKIDIPVLVLHSKDDQIVPIAAAGPMAAKLLKKATLKVYENYPARHAYNSCGPDQRRFAGVLQGAEPQRRGLSEHHRYERDPLAQAHLKGLRQRDCRESFAATAENFFANSRLRPRT